MIDSCIGGRCLNFGTCRNPQHPVEKKLREFLDRYPEPDPVGDGPVGFDPRAGVCPRVSEDEPPAVGPNLSLVLG